MNKPIKSVKELFMNLSNINIHIKHDMLMQAFHKNNCVTMESKSDDELMVVVLQKNGGKEHFL